MAPPPSNKRKVEDAVRGKIERPKKRIRKQKVYHSSSEDTDEEAQTDFTPIALTSSDEDAVSQRVVISKEIQSNSGSIPSQKSGGDGGGDDNNGDSDGDSDETASTLDSDNWQEDTNHPGVKRKPTSKRNDPDAFSTSISKILSTKLSQGARKDPVLSRSREAAEISSGIANERLERRAKAKMRADRKDELERGRVKDVLGLQSGMAGEVAEEEKRLRKIAQRGVVKLFNAVRAAQVKAEEAAREARKKGTVGYANREEKINEMSKQGFLDLINGDRSTKKPIVEAR
jgi:Rrp15p